MVHRILKQRSWRQVSAFTLIELLIVVAIIAILAAIAVPNFLEAQTRAKVSRVASDLRTYTTAMETYRIDHNKPPVTYRANAAQTRKWIAHYLTTPIAYMTAALPDPFNTDWASIPMNGGNPDNCFIVAWGPDHYLAPGNVAAYPAYLRAFPEISDGSQLRRKTFVFVFSLGPDKKFDVLDGQQPRVIQYEPTNGTVSRGEVYRING